MGLSDISIEKAGVNTTFFAWSGHSYRRQLAAIILETLFYGKYTPLQILPRLSMYLVRHHIMDLAPSLFQRTHTRTDNNNVLSVPAGDCGT